MDKEKYARRIADDLLALPENKAREVADFVHFLLEQLQLGIPLERSGLTRKEASDLRKRLSTFENDWNAPGMEVYDDL